MISAQERSKYRTALSTRNDMEQTVCRELVRIHVEDNILLRRHPSMKGQDKESCSRNPAPRNTSSEPQNSRQSEKNVSDEQDRVSYYNEDKTSYSHDTENGLQNPTSYRHLESNWYKSKSEYFLCTPKDRTCSSVQSPEYKGEVKRLRLTNLLLLVRVSRIMDLQNKKTW